MPRNSFTPFVLVPTTMPLSVSANGGIEVAADILATQARLIAPITAGPISRLSDQEIIRRIADLPLMVMLGIGLVSGPAGSNTFFCAGTQFVRARSRWQMMMR